MKMLTSDYIYCVDCEMFVDFWKYDAIDDTGHQDCNYRYVTEDELQVCTKDCEEDGCFNEINM